MIEDWYNRTAGEEQRRRFGYLLDFYESYLLNAPLEMIQGKPEVPQKSIRRRSAVRWTLLALGNVAAAVAIFFGAARLAENRAVEEMSAHLTTIEAPAGQRIDLTLSDGTRVKLNSGASLSYPNAFAQDSRKVGLKGEAYFNVEHDSERPFVVSTFASDIEVLGTEFNVNANEEENEFSASLVKGSIRLVDRLGHGREIVMKPEQTVKLSGTNLHFASCNINSAVCWKDGILNVDTQDFAKLMQKLEKAFGVRIVIDRKTMPELKYINGKLRVSDGVVAALTALQEVADFQFVKDYRTDIIYIR